MRSVEGRLTPEEFERAKKLLRNEHAASVNYTLCRRTEEMSKEELHAICMQHPLYRDAWERRN